MKPRISANLVFVLSFLLPAIALTGETGDQGKSRSPQASAQSGPSPSSGILGKSIELYSLRGENDVGKISEPFPNRRTMAVDGGFDVSYEDQPPMIPHSIDKDRITLQENSCLKCHSRVDSKLENAPKPPSSHFRTRDGKHTKKIVAGRYFCTQCHAPQINTRPLVKNTFKN